MDECQTGTLEKGEELVVCVSYSFWQHEIEKIETGKKKPKQKKNSAEGEREREKERNRKENKTTNQIQGKRN